MVAVAEEDCEEERGLNKRGREAAPFGVSKGEGGGVGYIEEDEVDEGLCFPESKAESVLPYPDEGSRLALGEAAKK